jgi:hypothetical protein
MVLGDATEGGNVDRRFLTEDAMNRKERRANEKTAKIALDNIQDLMRADGDHCTLCRAAFTHGGKSYGGYVREPFGPAIVSDCCRAKLDWVAWSALFCSAENAMASPSHLADTLMGRANDKQIVIGPLVQREDVPLPYFLFGLREADGPYIDMVQVESEEIRLAVLDCLAAKARGMVVHECGDELSMVTMCHTLWPCKKTEQLRNRVVAERVQPASAQRH